MQITRPILRVLVSVILCGVGVMLSLPQEVKAQSRNSECPKGAKEFVIYHINGVWTTYSDAVVNQNELKDFLKSSNIRSQLPAAYAEDKVCFIVDLLENSTTGVLNDLLETAHQVDQIAPKNFWLTLGDVATGDSLKLLNRLAVVSSDSSVVDVAAIQRHATKIVEDILECRSILLVPHSQGNLYARMAYEKVLQDPSVSPAHVAKAIRVVGIASPDLDAPSPYRNVYAWRTNHGDVLMGDNVPLFRLNDNKNGLVRRVDPTLYKANTDWATGPIDWLLNALGHGFGGHLHFEPSRGDIRTAMVVALSNLPLDGCFRFSQRTYNAQSSAYWAEITVQRIGGGNWVTVQTLSDSTMNPEEAKPLVDYIPLRTTIFFGPTETEQIVKISLLAITDTGEKTLNLSLNERSFSDPSLPLYSKELDRATLTINGTNCPDLSPNITVSNYGSGNEIYERKPVLSFNHTIPGASISATGSKGNVRLSSSAPGNANGAYANIKVNYQDIFIVTSPGKSGPGQAVATFTSSGSKAVSCTEREPYTQASSLADVSYYDSTGHSGHRYSHISMSCQLYPDPSVGGDAEDFSNPLSIPFVYGAEQYFEVDLISSATAPLFYGTSASASTNIGYSVIPNDPAAKVTWCRAAP